MRRRRRNPKGDTVAAAIGMGLVGAALGGISSAAAGNRSMFGRVVVGSITGGALGAGLGVVLVRSEGRMRNPAVMNPAAVGSALLAGTAIAVVPPLVALEIMGRQRPAPGAHGSLGRHGFDVQLERNAWIWTAGVDSGKERTRRMAIASAVMSLTQVCGPNDHVEVELVRPTEHLSVAPQICGGWTWRSGKHTGTSSTRREALVEGLAVLREFKDPS